MCKHYQSLSDESHRYCPSVYFLLSYDRYVCEDGSGSMSLLGARVTLFTLVCLKTQKKREDVEAISWERVVMEPDLPVLVVKIRDDIDE